MELEKIRQVLLWLKETLSTCNSIIIVTYSMAVLSRTRNGWLPDGVCSMITSIYVQGHAGVAVNEIAASFASFYLCATRKHQTPSQKEDKAKKQSSDSLKTTHPKVLTSH